MRKFGKDKPELMCFTLGEDEKVYTMPLAGSLPWPILAKMGAIEDDRELFEFQAKLIRHYIGEIADTLSPVVIGEIMSAWSEESGMQGAEVGESSASSESLTSTIEPSNLI